MYRLAFWGSTSQEGSLDSSHRGGHVTPPPDAQPFPYRPAPIWRAASFRAAAHTAESVAFFLFLAFAARVAIALTCLRSRLALWRTLRAFLAALVAAWSMRVSALPSVRITRAGTGWSTHAGLVSAVSNVQRAVVQGGVAIVGDGDARVVVDVVVVLLVDVVVVLLIVVLDWPPARTVASRRTSPAPSAT